MSIQKARFSDCCCPAQLGGWLAWCCPSGEWTREVRRVLCATAVGTAWQQGVRLRGAVDGDVWGKCSVREPNTRGRRTNRSGVGCSASKWQHMLCPTTVVVRSFLSFFSMWRSCRRAHGMPYFVFVFSLLDVACFLLHTMLARYKPWCVNPGVQVWEVLLPVALLIARF